MFSGLATNLAAGRWKPSGVPAIYRLLEGLAADPATRLTVLVLASDPTLHALFPHRRKISVPGIGDLDVIPPSADRRLYRRIWMHVRHAASCLAHVIRWRPHLVYATNAVIVPAGFIARAGLAPVVLRLMGIFPFHRNLIAGGGGLSGLIQRWLFQSPFAWVLCTFDGSGSSTVLSRLTTRAPVAFALNGVDLEQVAASGNSRILHRQDLDGRPLVLFVGRLVGYKGAHEFLEAAAAYLAAHGRTAQFVVVGDGPEAGGMRAWIASRGLEADILMPGGVPHTEIPDWLAAATVYVSLNHHGNLSNANLEALAAGCCSIWRSTNHLEGSAKEAMLIVPPDAVALIDPAGGPEVLASEIRRLLVDPALRQRMGKLARQTAAGLLRPWPTRIASELRILKEIAATARPPAQLTGILDTNPDFLQ